jgi:3-mercaptopyruvate sulfurtransferase SseA
MKSINKILEIISTSLLLCLITTSLTFAGNVVKSRVSTQWVSDNLDSIKLVDLSFDNYNKGHLPGAIKMIWGSEVYTQGEDHMLPRAF